MSQGPQQKEERARALAQHMPPGGPSIPPFHLPFGARAFNSRAFNLDANCNMNALLLGIEMSI